MDFDREKLALHGLNLSTAATYLRNRINGATASKYREDGDEYDIKVRYAPEYRTSLESIENILVYNAKGEGVRIKDLGKVVERFAPPTIERKDRERIVTVSAVISGAPLGDVVAAGNAIIDRMEKPSDITIQVAGSFEDQQDSFRDLGTLGVLIIILVFIDGSPVRVAYLSVYSDSLRAVCHERCADGAVHNQYNAECDESAGQYHADRYRGEEWYRAHRLHHSLPRTRAVGAECRGYGRQEPSPSGVDDNHDYHSRYDSDGHQQRSGF